MRVRAFFLVVLVSILVSPATAGAYVFWTGGGTIGRADNDGSNVNPSFIGPSVYTGAETAPIAVDAGHLYYTTVHEDQMGTLSVARTNLDDTEAALLPEGFLQTADGISAVDAGHLYWFDGNGIGRANLDGTDRELEFLPGIGGIGGIAIYNGFIYWTEYDGGFGEYIGRANLTTKIVDPEFVALDEGGGGPSEEERGPRAIAVDANGIYFTMEGGGDFEGKIGHGGLAGGKAVLDEIPGAHANPLSLAIEGSDLYWFNIGSGIARASLGGATSVVDPDFIQTGGTYLAVNSAGPPPPPPPPSPPTIPAISAPPLPAASTPPKPAPTNAFKLRTLKLNQKTGSAKLTLDLPGPGKLALAGHGVNANNKAIKSAGAAPFVMMPTAATRATLKKLGRKTIKVTVTFTPTTGPASSRTFKVTLRIG